MMETGLPDRSPISPRARIASAAQLAALLSCAHSAPTPAEREESLRGADELTACDRKIDPLRHQILAALETRSQAIRGFAQANPRSDKARGPSRLLHIGPATFREFIGPPLPKDEWSEKRYGWLALYELYQRIEQQPVNADWVRLNRGARGILPDDAGRLLRHGDYSLDERSLKTLVDAIAELRSCYRETAPDCAGWPRGARPAPGSSRGRWCATTSPAGRPIPATSGSGCTPSSSISTAR